MKSTYGYPRFTLQPSACCRWPDDQALARNPACPPCLDPALQLGSNSFDMAADELGDDHADIVITNSGDGISDAPVPCAAGSQPCALAAADRGNDHVKLTRRH